MTSSAFSISYWSGSWLEQGAIWIWLSGRLPPSVRVSRTLRTSPFTCRKASQSPFPRELLIPFDHFGYVALFEIVDPTDVVVSAVRHQLEDDYH